MTWWRRTLCTIVGHRFGPDGLGGRWRQCRHPPVGQAALVVPDMRSRRRSRHATRLLVLRAAHVRRQLPP